MLRKLFIFAFTLMLLAGVGLGIYFLRPSKRYAQHYTKGLIYFDKNKYSEAIVQFNAAKKIRSKSKTLLLYLAESYRRNMQNSESIAILNTIISEYPKDNKAHRRLIRSYQMNKQHLKALAACDNYIKIVKDDVYIRNLRGLVLVSLKQTNQAKEEFLLAIKLKKDYSDAYKNLAKVYWKEKDIDSAINTLKEFLIIKPNHFEIRNLLGDYYRFSGQLIKASKEFTYLYEKYPKKILETSAKLSIVLLLSQQMEKLQELVDASFRKNPSKLEISPLLLYARGALSLEKKQYQEAIADFELAQQRGLKLASLRYSLALSYDKINKTFLAIKELNSLIDQEPNYMSAHQLLVQFLINENQAQQAVEHCDKYLQRMPARTELREIKATALMSSGRTKEAQNMYRQLSRLGNNPNIGQRNAILLAISQGKTQEVIERLDQLLKSKQQDPYPLYLLLGRNHLLLKKYEKAIEYANLASEAKPFRISAWQLLAQIYVTSQKPEKAISQYLKILKEEPNHRKIPFELANLYYQLKQTKKALNILKKHNKMNSRRPAYLELLAKISYQDKEYSQAIQYLERIKIKTVSQKKRLGDIYRQLGKHKEALEAYGENKNDPEIVIRQGLAFFLDKKWSQAIEKMNQYFELKPEQTLPHLLYCAALMEESKVEEALQHSKEVLRRTKSRQWLVHFTRSVIFLKKNDFTKAENELSQIPAYDKAIGEGVLALVQFSKKQSIDILPVLTVLLVTEMKEPVIAAKLEKKISVLLRRTLFVRYLQSVLMEATGKMEEFQVLVDSLAEEPNSPAYINAFVGRSLSRQGRFREAEKFLELALPMHRENSAMIMELAQVYLKLNKKEKAKEFLEEILGSKVPEEMKKEIKKFLSSISD